MCKPFFRNFTVYALFLTNFTHAIQHGFDWLFWIAAVLTAVMLVLDIWEVIHRA